MDTIYCEWFMDTVYGKVCMLVSYLVAWCFEPSQPQMITSGLKDMYEQYLERVVYGHDLLRVVYGGSL